MANKYLIVGGLTVVVASAAAWWQFQPDDATAVPGGPIVSAMHGAADQQAPVDAAAVIVPELSAVATGGKFAFENKCSACHGINAAGTDTGPPLIHNLYRPGHHGDAAFSAAAANGVVAHHWRFGDMPRVPGGVPETDMRWIVQYIRELQQANGVL